MTVKGKFDEMLELWAESLRAIEKAAGNRDWQTARKLIKRNNRYFDQMRSTIAFNEDESALARLTSSQRRVIFDGSKSLMRVTEALQSWQQDVREEIRGTKRSRQTVQAYSQQPPGSPRHIRVFAAGTETPADERKVDREA